MVEDSLEEQNMGNREVNTDGLEYGNNHNSLGNLEFGRHDYREISNICTPPSLDTLKAQKGGKKKI